MPVANLFHDSEPPAQGERFDTLLSHRNLQIERILSSSRIESVDYLQEQDEWVLLARGTASMTVAGKVLELVAGDHLFLPAGTPHRVEHTSEGALWLAIHLHPGNGV
ncbi:cupin domain-containing protein [Phytopseudomonas seleniipraecipitans]|uniref:Cupin 2 domain-containing protein n=1 Tax=Phytopseudomonas seleniipraecipitans TaxID=640205 RepID=A0A1G7MDA8_9GAMM|nr:cupin domain-containing protein [Pseudomonas seleniipraecipitans]SDF59656.1 cupin 2 domain-containing protein [Pseudomonas seleniipraecipitans]